MYGHKYTSPQSERKIKTDEIKFSTHLKRTLADDSLVTAEYIKADTMSNKYDLPLDHFNDLKNVCTNVRIFL